jgi:transcriptional regulator with GAF, ATPase, and Fis domain
MGTGRPQLDVVSGCVDRQARDRECNMTKSSQRSLSVYTVASEEGGQDAWVSIGRAIAHDDDRGFDISLRALPLGARLLLREPQQEQSDKHADLSLAEQVEAFERAAIELCLIETGGNIAAALTRLKVPRRTLNEKMARLGIDRRRLTMSFRQRAAEPADTGEPAESHNGATDATSDPHSGSAVVSRKRNHGLQV